MSKKIFIYLISTLVIMIITIFSAQVIVQTSNFIFFYKDEKKIDFFVKNKLLIPIFPYTNFENNRFLPLSLVSNKNHINCRENTYWHEVKTDKYGFNNSNSIYEKNIENIFIGDSYVFGNCVKNKDNVVKKFDKISKTNSLNLSMVGNGPLLNYAALREYYPENKKIKNIIYFFYSGNDLRDLERNMHNEILMKYVHDDDFSQNLKSKDSNKNLFLLKKMEQSIKNYKEGLKYNPKAHIKFLTLFDLRMKYKAFIQKKKLEKDSYNEEIYNYFDENLKRLKKFALEKNTKLLIVYLPSISNLAKKRMSGELDSDRDKVINLIKKNDIYALDMTEYLKNYDIEEIYPSLNSPYTRGRPIHLNEFGYSIVAQKIKKYLIE